MQQAWSRPHAGTCTDFAIGILGEPLFLPEISVYFGAGYADIVQHAIIEGSQLTTCPCQ
jgi:hypothetical protein